MTFPFFYLTRLALLLSLFLIFSLLVWVPQLGAQSNFIPLEGNEILEKNEDTRYSPFVQISGEYRFQFLYQQGKDLEREYETNVSSDDVIWEQDAWLHLGSIVNRHVSLHLEWEIEHSSFNANDLHDSRSSANATDDTPRSQEISTQLRKAYLEYRSNPKSEIKIGQHYVEIGDQRGKVFSGLLMGISQSCKAGTWCYDIGGFSTSPGRGNWMYYLSLDYPIFNERHTDGSAKKVFNVEVFQVLYSDENVPLGRNNHAITRDTNSENYVQSACNTNFSSTACSSAINQVHHQVDRDGKPIYFDVIENRYFGVRISWESTNWEIYTDIISNQGKRRYHLKKEKNQNLSTPNLGSNSALFDDGNRSRQFLQAGVVEWEIQYKFATSDLRFIGLYATGDRDEIDNDHTGADYLRGTRGYFEIIPGSYRGTQLYFNGNDGDSLYNGGGLGHSVNNIQMYGIGYQYRLDHQLSYETGLFQLSHNESVLNSAGEYVKDIGIEWDNIFRYKLDRVIDVEVHVHGIFAGNAFSLNRYSRPKEDPQNLLRGFLRFLYSF